VTAAGLAVATPHGAATVSSVIRAVPSALRTDTTVTEFLQPLRRLLADGQANELCINQPGEVFVESAGVWQRHVVPEFTFRHCQSLATAIATLTGQHTSEQHPLLSAALSSGERVQIVQPSATPADQVAVCIRKPSLQLLRLEDFAAQGLFNRVRASRRELQPFEHELLALQAQSRWVEFFRLAVRRHQTVVVAGKTGSGKTTFMKGLVEEVPTSERLITIEDAAELTLPNHPNKLHLFYSKGGQGASSVSAKLLLEACLRLRPDRIFLAEMRGEEAFYFLRLAASGHPGSVTSVHAGSCDLAFEQIALMVRESAGGGGMTMPEIKRLARSVIDVVVHIGVDGGGRYISGVHYDPQGRLRGEQQGAQQGAA
jgi:type IV secretion system protein VirB11